MIEFTTQVIFRDLNRTVLKIYNVGDVIPFTAKNNKAGYWITSMGGIWFDEARELV